MVITFWGAAKTTTGSFHLLENRGRRVVLDCGLFQGHRSEFYARNADFPCQPKDVDALLLSHAHIDHCGNIPNFTKHGFDGPIFCTAATQDLTRELILDSAHIQEKDAIFVNKQRRKHGEEPVEPLYSRDDAEAAFPLFVGMGMNRDFCFVDGFCGKFIEAGHILGSAQIELDIDLGAGAHHRLHFSGDIGRGGKEILQAPEIPSGVETLIMESTYGDRNSPPTGNLRQVLLELLVRVSERGGKIIIPAFSVGRTQEVVYQMNLLFNEGALPRIPIFVDSPLSTNVTEIFRRHPECYNRHTRDLLRSDGDPFGFKSLTYIKDVEESKRLNDLREPCVIIASSGMCEAGRILHHLRNSITDPKNCVLIVGFQAENTLGRRIVEKKDRVRIFGEEVPLRCEVVSMSGFSGHADGDELRDYAFRVAERSGGMLRRIFLVHGESKGQTVLAEYLRSALGVEVYVPNRGDRLEIS